MTVCQRAREGERYSEISSDKESPDKESPDRFAESLLKSFEINEVCREGFDLYGFSLSDTIGDCSTSV